MCLTFLRFCGSRQTRKKWRSVVITIGYRENDPQPVDIRTVLGLLTLFHPKWNELGKGACNRIRFQAARFGLLSRSRMEAGTPSQSGPWSWISCGSTNSSKPEFQGQYSGCKGDSGGSGKLGRRKEIRYNQGKPFTLALSQAQTKYLISGGDRRLYFFGKGK
jgi:hypothetical protein